MRATAPGCLLLCASQAIGKHLCDRGAGAGVPPESIPKENSGPVGARAGRSNDAPRPEIGDERDQFGSSGVRSAAFSTRRACRRFCSSASSTEICFAMLGVRREGTCLSDVGPTAGEISGPLCAAAPGSKSASPCQAVQRSRELINWWRSDVRRSVCLGGGVRARSISRRAGRPRRRVSC